jgi:hypothetical protein
VNKMHEDMAPIGTIVENFIAPVDFTANDSIIKKGSWCVAIEPSAEGREKVNNGEFTGVSVQGLGLRTPVDLAKSQDDAQSWLESREWLQKDAVLVPDKPGANNWIDRTGTGNLPKFIGDIAGDLITERGKSTGEAIQLAVGICKRWCDGQGNVTATTREKACTAIAEWDAKKAQAQVSKDGDDYDHRVGLLKGIGQLLGFAAEDEVLDPIVKRYVSPKERKKLASSGGAMPGGSFPIASEQDLRNAIKAVGRAKNYTAAKAHIIKRAKALGLTNLLPASWKASEVRKEAGTVKAVSEDASTSTATDGGTGSEERTIEDRVASLETGMEKVSKAVEPLAKLPGQIEELTKKLGDKDGDEGDDDKPTPEDLQKRLDDFTTDTAGKLEEISKSVDKLASGESTQTDDDDTERERIAKMDGEARTNAELLA